METKIENLEQETLEKYLVEEALKQQKHKKGTSWKNLKTKLKSQV